MNNFSRSISAENHTNYFALLHQQIQPKLMDRVNAPLKSSTEKIKQVIEDEDYTLIISKISTLFQQVPKESPFAASDLIVFDNQYKGLLPLNGIKANELKHLENLYKRICQKKTKIQIRGSKKFTRGIEYDLLILMSRKLGKKLIEKLAFGHREVVIQEKKRGGSSSQEIAFHRGVPYGRIKIETASMTSLLGRTSYGRRQLFFTLNPRFLIIAHELAHEYQEQVDTRNYYFLLNRKVNDGFTNLLEKKTITGFSNGTSVKDFFEFNEWLFCGQFNILPRHNHWGASPFSPGDNPLAVDQNRNTPLHYAAAFNVNLEIQDLLKRGAKVNSKNLWGKTPIMLARKPSTLVLLLKHQELSDQLNIQDHNGRTALWYHVQEKKIITSYLLLKYGADPFLPDQFGISPYQIAEQSKNSAMHKLSQVMLRFHQDRVSLKESGCFH